jgi:uncharacterized protein YcaQ
MRNKKPGFLIPVFSRSYDSPNRVMVDQEYPIADPLSHMEKIGMISVRFSAQGAQRKEIIQHYLLLQLAKNGKADTILTNFTYLFNTRTSPG